MNKSLIIFFTLISLYSSQISLNSYRNQFLIEINKFKPEFKDKALEKEIKKIAKTYVVDNSYTNKIVDLNHIMNNCHLDFEIKLVQSEELPASNHLIAHIIVGGLIIPGQEQKKNKNDLWAANVGVVLEKDENSVYSLVYDLRVHFDKQTFTEKSGLDLTNVDERALVNSIFYNKCLEIANTQMSNIKIPITPITPITKKKNNLK